MGRMKLYHGSLAIVSEPRIIVPTRSLDYGAGFYATTSYDQARLWTRRRMSSVAEVGYVNIYELDDICLNVLKVLWFEGPTEEWVDFVMSNRTDADFFVMSNRTDADFRHDNDLVYGPVANDRVYAAFALYESGFLDKSGLIRELRTYSLVDQMLFHTKLSLKYLQFIEAEEVRL